MDLRWASAGAGPATFGRAAAKMGGPFGTLVRLLILSGQRRDEVARMRWDEIDLDRRKWTLGRERV